MKAERVENEVVVYWQDRYRPDEYGNVLRIGPDNEVIEKMRPDRARFKDKAWVEAGRINLCREEVYEMAGLKDLDRMVMGIMKQVCELIALGWGETPSQVVEWFGEPESGDFLVDSRYMVEVSRGPFSGMAGNAVRLKYDADNEKSVLYLEYDGDEIADTVDNVNLLRDALICLCPMR